MGKNKQTKIKPEQDFPPSPSATIAVYRNAVSHNLPAKEAEVFWSAGELNFFHRLFSLYTVRSRAYKQKLLIIDKNQVRWWEGGRTEMVHRSMEEENNGQNRNLLQRIPQEINGKDNLTKIISTETWLRTKNS